MMRLGSIAGEAWRNVRGGTSSAVPSALLLGVLTGAVLAVTLADVLGVGAGAAAYRDAGASVLILRSPGNVDPSACESLNTSVTAGAIRRAARDTVPSATPGTGIPTYEITPGFARIIAPGGSMTGGALVSTEVAGSYGMAVGDVLRTGTGGPRVGGIFEHPDDGRLPALGFAVLLPVAPTSLFDECWAQTWPESAQLEELLRTTVVPAFDVDTPDDVDVMQLNGSLGREFDAATRFRDRPTRYLGLGAMAAAFLVQLVTVRLRRIELASARHSGVTLGDLWVMVLLEAAAWVISVVAVSFMVIAWFTVQVPAGDVPTVAMLGVVTAGGVVGAGLAGASVAVIGSRERFLFADFKRRR
jgi:hypothetical protein